MRKSRAFLTKVAVICGVSLFALTATTGAVAAVQLQWTKQTIPAFGGGGNVDVFGLLYTKDASVSCSSGCLWANARYEANSQYSRTYVTNNISSPSWQGCDSPYSNHIAGRFGLDRSSTTSPYPAATAYIPNGPVLNINGGVTDMSYVAGICQSNNSLNTTQTNEAASFLKTSASNAYYVKVNTSGGDTVMVTTNGGSTWSEITPAGSLTINGIDGDDTAQKVFLATSGGLYSCTGAQYPACATWTLVAQQPDGVAQNLTTVLYKYNYLQGATGTQLLVVGTDSGAYIGKYDSAGNIAWSSAIVPQFSATNAPVVTGIAADQNYVYISSYGYTAAPGMTKAEALKKYSPRNLILSGCNQRSKLLQGLTDGGVTVYTTQWNGVAANMNKFLSYSYVTTSNAFYSAAVLGVSLQIDPTTNYATRIFAPSLAPVCNQGGYSVGQFSGYSYTAPSGTSTTIECYPSGTSVSVGTSCPAGDIGSVFYVYGTSPGQHGLVAALADQVSALKWDSSVTTSTTGATGTGIGHGRANTDLIVTTLNTIAPAAKACTDVTASASGINYNDWFLPSGNGGELNQLYTYKTLIGGFQTMMPVGNYWSSAEKDASDAWYQSFGMMSLFGTTVKSDTLYVRCIRAF